MFNVGNDVVVPLLSESCLSFCPTSEAAHAAIRKMLYRNRSRVRGSGFKGLPAFGGAVGDQGSKI